MFKKSFHFLRYALFVCLLFVATFFLYENFFCLTSVSAQSVQTASSQNVSTTSELVIESITAKYPSKTYDGTTLVELEVVVSNFEVGDEVTIEAYGNTTDANVGNNKYVFFDTQDFVISSSLNNEYTLPAKTDDDFAKILFDITKKQVSLTWVTSSNPNAYVYNGQDQRGTVRAYYVNVEEKPVYLNLSWSGNLVEGNFNYSYLNEFKNHGAYKATTILGEEESNYEIEDSYQRFTMLRAQSQIDIVGSTSFTYTGAEQDASRNATMAVLNNNEQTLTISNYSNYLFTTVSEGNLKEVQVNVQQSQNYTSATKTYIITVAKAQSIINIEGIPTYTYIKDVVQYVSGATVNNAEQTIKYSNNSFLTVAEGNSLFVSARVTETDNYLPSEVTFSIIVEKQTIDASSLVWGGGSKSFTYDGKLKSVTLANSNNELFNVVYSNNEQKNAGDYVASARIELLDNDNFNLIGHVENLNWSIKKAKIRKPDVTNLTSKYTGSLQYANISTDSRSNYIVLNNSQTNAGNYKVTIRLKDLFNTQWLDETIDNIYVDWKIEKKEISLTDIKTILVYNAKKQTVNVPQSDLYTVVENAQTEVGKYQTYIVLNDQQNYKWSNSDDSCLIINWQIISNDNYNTATPVVVIILTIIIVALLSVSITLHFTIKARRKRRKKLVPVLETAQGDYKQQNIENKNNATKKDVVVNQDNSLSKEGVKAVSNPALQKPTKKPNLEAKKENANLKTDAKQSISLQPKMVEKKELKTSLSASRQKDSSSKSRKKRMISMKKTDKRKRRQDEIKKKVIAQKPKAKRGRPPKKETTKRKKK